MLNDIVFGRYYFRDSKIHSMNPNAKMICVLLFVMFNLLISSMPVALFMVGFTFLFIFFTNIHVKEYIKGLYQVRFLVIFLFVINIILNADMMETLIVIIRLLSLLLYTMVLTFTTKPNDLNNSLVFVMTPLKIFKVPINKIASLISISLKFIPMIFVQASTILKAQACRGMKTSSIKDKVGTTKNMLIPLIILTLKRAEELGVSLEMKLYNYDKRNFKSDRQYNFFDYYLVSMHLLIVLVVFIKEMIL